MLKLDEIEAGVADVPGMAFTLSKMDVLLLIRAVRQLGGVAGAELNRRKYPEHTGVTTDHGPANCSRCMWERAVEAAIFDGVDPEVLELLSE